MPVTFPPRMDSKSLADKAAAARRRMAEARTTQERQHLEGMALYWEELLDEQSAALAAADNSDAPQKLAG